MKILKVSVLFLFTAALSFAQSIPAVRAKALDNSEITLPNASSQQVLILVVGFSQERPTVQGLGQKNLRRLPR